MNVGSNHSQSCPWLLHGSIVPLDSNTVSLKSIFTMQVAVQESWRESRAQGVPLASLDSESLNSRHGVPGKQKILVHAVHLSFFHAPS